MLEIWWGAQCTAVMMLVVTTDWVESAVRVCNAATQLWQGHLIFQHSLLQVLPALSALHCSAVWFDPTAAR